MAPPAKKHPAGSLRRSSDGLYQLTETDALYREIGRAIAAWAHVEGALCSLLLSVTDQSPIIVDVRHAAVSASFYAIENFRSKLNMVSAACDMTLEALSGALAEDGEKLITEWRAIEKACGRQSQKRNWLAHFMIFPQTAERPPFLARSIYNMAATKTFNSPEHTKLRLHDVAAYTRDFMELTARVNRFAEWCSFASQTLTDQQGDIVEKIAPGIRQMKPTRPIGGST